MDKYSKIQHQDVDTLMAAGIDIYSTFCKSQRNKMFQMIDMEKELSNDLVNFTKWLSNSIHRPYSGVMNGRDKEH